MTCIGTVKNGMVLLDPEAKLPEGTRVRVEPLPKEPDPADHLEAAAVSTGIADLASQHDHYIYGTPKREE
jgi:hypothetical protein